jgi:anti-sigma regulatory factor (Ser/Thr protein kinase)
MSGAGAGLLQAPVDHHTALTMPPTCNPDDTLPPATSEQGVSGGAYHRATSRPIRRPLQLALPADPVTPSVVRQRLREWLAAWSLPADQLDDIVLAVSEAVSNSVEHAYLDQPLGMVDVRGGIETTPDRKHRVTIIVRDHGCWRSPPSDHENRRRGIPLMRAYMESVTIGQPPDDPVGTWVVLRTRAISAGRDSADDSDGNTACADD